MYSTDPEKLRLYQPYIEKALTLKEGESFRVECGDEASARRVAYHLRSFFNTEGLTWRFLVSEKEFPALVVKDVRPVAKIVEAVK